MRILSLIFFGILIMSCAKYSTLNELRQAKVERIETINMPLERTYISVLSAINQKVSGGLRVHNILNGNEAEFAVIAVGGKTRIVFYMSLAPMNHDQTRIGIIINLDPMGLWQQHVEEIIKNVRTDEMESGLQPKVSS